MPDSFLSFSPSINQEICRTLLLNKLPFLLVSLQPLQPYPCHLLESGPHTLICIAVAAPQLVFYLQFSSTPILHAADRASERKTSLLTSFPDSSLPQKTPKICSVYQAFNNLAPALFLSIDSVPVGCLPFICRPSLVNFPNTACAQYLASYPAPASAR